MKFNKNYFLTFISFLFSLESICYSNNDSILTHGNLFKNPQFSDFLNIVINKGYEYFYNGPGLDLILSHCSEQSYLRKEDFNSYSLKKRKPITINYNGYDIFTNSAPSFGGSLIIFLLKLV